MANTRIIALFNLKPGKTTAAYEAWARSRDLPTVNSLPSIALFEVYRSKQLLVGSGQPSHQYIEIIDIKDMDRFGQDVAAAEMQAIAGEFAAFADVEFIVMDKLDWEPKA